MVGSDITTISTFVRLGHRGWIQKGHRAPAEFPDSSGAQRRLFFLYSTAVPACVHCGVRELGRCMATGTRRPGHGDRPPRHCNPRQFFFLYSINLKPPRSPVVLITVTDSAFSQSEESHLHVMSKSQNQVVHPRRAMTPLNNEVVRGMEGSISSYAPSQTLLE